MKEARTFNLLYRFPATLPHLTAALFERLDKPLRRQISTGQSASQQIELGRFFVRVLLLFLRLNLSGTKDGSDNRGQRRRMPGGPFHTSGQERR